MAPLKNVTKLCDLCQKNVTTSVLNVLRKIRETGRESESEPARETGNAEECKIFREYLTENLPLSSCAEILDTILQDGEQDNEIKCMALLVLQGANSKRLKFSLGFPVEYHDKILSHLKNSSSELENADFRGLWLQDSNLETFCRVVLPRMSRLRQLALPHIATDHMLEVIGDNCRQLISLDLYGSTGISSSGFRTLSRKLGPKLQFINLGGPTEFPLEPEQIAECLPSLREIASFGSYPFAGAALAIAAGKNIRTKVKYIHDRYTTPETLNQLPEVCPNLNAIFLDTPEKGILKLLTKFSRLTRLKVSKLDCEDFHTVLETLKPDQLARLTVLELVNSRGSLDLFKVSNSFPNLEVFEIYYSTSVHVSFKDNFKFPNLKKLIIYDTEVSGAASEAILSSCPQIVTLTLAHCEEVTDEMFFQILEKNPMKNCRDLSLLFAPQLSSDSLRYIISCLENIRYVGRLDNWNVGWTEVEELRFEIRHFNLDVTLGEQFNNIDKFHAVENQENGGLLGFGFDEVDGGAEAGEDVFFDVLLVPDDDEEFFFA